jgi:hypothetical protein
MKCLLCDRRAVYVGFFVPRKPERFGGRAVPVARN